MIARGGQCFLRLCSTVQQTTIQPWITRVIQQGGTVNTDEYSMYARLSAWGYVHVTVNHSEGECARDADGDGINEVHHGRPLESASLLAATTPWHLIRIPIESRSICGFNPTGGSRKKYVLREMDVRAALSRLYGNWTECVSQHFLPLYIGFFQAMHNIRQRGHSLLSPLLSLLLTSAP